MYHPSSQASGPAFPAAPFYLGFADEEEWDPLPPHFPSTCPSLRFGLWRKAPVLAHLPPPLPSTPVGFCTEQVSWASDCPRPVLPTFPLETFRPLLLSPVLSCLVWPWTPHCHRHRCQWYLQPEGVCVRHMVWSLK